MVPPLTPLLGKIGMCACALSEVCFVVLCKVPHSIADTVVATLSFVIKAIVASCQLSHMS